MKLLRLIMIFTIISTIYSNAQDYQTFNSKRTALFSRDLNGQSDIQCVRIDSVKFQADSVFYPFAVIQENESNSYDCRFSKLASWIGKTVTISANGMNTFINRTGDSIRINTKATLSEKWIAYQIQDSITIEASITKFDTLSFLGLKDSVKTISFQAFDKDMKPFDYQINNMKLQLSKNYGFVTIVNFNFFPIHDSHFKVYNLIGLTNPEVGVQNLTWFDVHDYQVGDEIHILSASNPGMNSGAITTNKAIYKYIERTNFPDSIVYKYNRIQSIELKWSDSTSYKYYDDTLSITIHSNSLFDKLPGEIMGVHNTYYFYYMKNGSVLSKIDRSGREFYSGATDSCLGQADVMGCLSNYVYPKGLGGPYHECMDENDMSSSSRNLVYYKKGDKEWGTKLDITSAVESELSDKVKIYPNPAQDKVNINIPNIGIGDYSVSIYDVLGNVVKHSKIQESNSIINIENIETGIYMLKILNNGAVVKFEKLIIE